LTDRQPSWTGAKLGTGLSADQSFTALVARRAGFQEAAAAASAITRP